VLREGGWFEDDQAAVERWWVMDEFTTRPHMFGSTTEQADRDVICPVRRGRCIRQRLPETPETHVALLITQRQQVHNRDMTQEHRHANGPGLVAVLHWVRSHLPRWRRRPPTVGVREPRRPKPILPAAAVALKEPRTGLMHWIKLGNRHTGEHT
jgi:hypothetical protein